jgi:endonuclease YncB( thermonuclease family)
MLRVGLLVIAGFLFFATPALAQSPQTVTVERVVDGDTIEVDPAVGGTQDVRLLGVDTPETVDPNEPVEPYGPEASAFTNQQLEGERVTLIFDQEKTDQYGRALAYVRISGQGETFNETLLRQGYAQLYIVPPNDRYEARFSQAQDQARQAQRGIWGLPKDQQCELADRGNEIGEGSSRCQGQGPRPAPDLGEGREDPPPVRDQYVTEGDVGNPKDVIPGSGVRRVPHTGGPPYLVLATLVLLGAALMAVRGALRR